MTQLTELLGRLHVGDNDARDALFAVAYTELHRLAQSRLRDGGRNVTLDTTITRASPDRMQCLPGHLRFMDFLAMNATVKILRCIWSLANHMCKA